MNKYCTFAIRLDIVQISKFPRRAFGNCLAIFTQRFALNVMVHSPPTPNIMCCFASNVYKHWFTFQHQHRPYILFYFQHLACALCVHVHFGLVLIYFYVFCLFVCVHKHRFIICAIVVVNTEFCLRHTAMEMYLQIQYIFKFTGSSDIDSETNIHTYKGAAKRTGSIWLIFTIIIPCSILRGVKWRHSINNHFWFTPIKNTYRCVRCAFHLTWRTDDEFDVFHRPNGKTPYFISLLHHFWFNIVHISDANTF